MTTQTVEHDVRLNAGGVEQIIQAYTAASDADKVEGADWYGVASYIAHDIHPEHGAAVVAALSPNRAWDINIIAAREVVATGWTKWQSGRNVDKARRILDGETADNVLGGNKVRAFWRAIEGSDHVVIDRHALGVFRGKHATARDVKVLERKGAYALVAQAYRHAARILGVGAVELQAITWLYWRRTKGVTA